MLIRIVNKRFPATNNGYKRVVADEMYARPSKTLFDATIGMTTIGISGILVFNVQYKNAIRKL